MSDTGFYAVLAFGLIIASIAIVPVFVYGSYRLIEIILNYTERVFTLLISKRRYGRK
jgi:hypothetical protein